VAWWTFEDGPVSAVVKDVSEQRYKSKLSSYTIFTKQNLTKRLREISQIERMTYQLKAEIENIEGKLQAFGGNHGEFQWIDATKVPIVSLNPSVAPHTSTQAAVGDAFPPVSSYSDDTGSAEIFDEADTENIPVPSFKERNFCPLEIRRFRLAQRGRALMTETKCPLGCGSLVRRIHLRAHKKFYCESRKIRCRRPGCGEQFPISAQEVINFSILIEILTYILLC